MTQALKNKIIAGALGLVVLASGVVYMNGGNESLVFAASCLNAKVQIEYNGNRYCGSNAEFVSDKAKAIVRLKANEVSGEDDYGTLQLFIKNDAKFADDIGKELAAKYDPAKNEFDGTKFNNDFIYQMQLALDVMGAKGLTNLPGGTVEIGNQLYDLYY